MNIAELIREVAMEAKDPQIALKLKTIADSAEANVTVIVVEGGIVQNICADTLQMGRTLLIDYDCDGDDRVIDIPQGSSPSEGPRTQPATVSVMGVDILPEGGSLDLKSIWNQIQADVESENDAESISPSGI